MVLICASLSCKYRPDKAGAFILRIVNADAMVQGINDFCRSIGLTRTGGELPLHIMNYHIGRDLDANSPRTLAVLHPLRLVITNLPQDHLEMVQAKVNPAVACLPYTGRILPGHCCSLLPHCGYYVLKAQNNPSPSASSYLVWFSSHVPFFIGKHDPLEASAAAAHCRPASCL